MLWAYDDDTSSYKEAEGNAVATRSDGEWYLFDGETFIMKDESFIRLITRYSAQLKYERKASSS